MMMESDLPLTNTRQRKERVSKGKGRKKGHRKAALAHSLFYLWRGSDGQGYAPPNPY